MTSEFKARVEALYQSFNRRVDPDGTRVQALVDQGYTVIEDGRGRGFGGGDTYVVLRRGTNVLVLGMHDPLAKDFKSAGSNRSTPTT